MKIHRESTPLVLKKYCTNMVGCCSLEEVGFARPNSRDFLYLEWLSPLGNSSDGRKLNKMMRKLLLQLLKIQIMFCVTKLNAKGLILVLALQRKQGGSFSMP